MNDDRWQAALAALFISSYFAMLTYVVAHLAGLLP